MSRFKVGDILTGISESPYGLTNSSSKVVVEHTYLYDGENDMLVRIIERRDNRHIEEEYLVNSKYFKLVEPAKPKLETLIKRINIGAKALDQILEHYPDKVKWFKGDDSGIVSPDDYETGLSYRSIEN